ncbi:MULTISPECIES: LysR family transcriptional regulator [Achromobacter]|uniref:LysR family transcriptional regulator n=1 Tax=Achromobacter marplatensis TaxID=470868 RepID=A0AA42WDS0_9BURK|nr:MULTISPECIES: LysR family transcriptional regulator [Achromobacter]MDH2052391.1 LysR family transcriptional regulator [Achromobacter marplatensis]PQZ67691.1 LysR family transcriptional regulator [Achromobacter sp. MYb9]HCW20827.1 LysR family transcriptional regulator [Achromobacter sp.]
MTERQTNRPAAPLNLRQIEVFHAIMVTGSLSAAGRMLFVSQPAVSRTLASCEQRLGYELFERSGGRLIPTPEARRIFTETSEIYAKVRNVNELAHDLGRASADLVRIVSNSGPGIYLLPQAIIQVKEEFHARFQFAGMNTDLVVSHLLLGRADIGISLFPVSHPDLIHTEIGHANVVCIAPRKFKLREGAMLSANDVMALGLPIIGYAPQSALGQTLAQFFKTHGLDPVVDVEVNSPLDTCSMVTEGVGIGFVDSTCVTPSLLRDVAVFPLNPPLPLKLLALRSKTDALSAAAKRFLVCFKEAVREHQHAPAMSGRRG